MKKPQLKGIRQLANKLKPETYTHPVYAVRSGTELKEKMPHLEDKSQPFDPGSFYQFTLDAKTNVNHYRRMKRLTQRHGIESAMKYFDSKPKRKAA